MFTAASTTALLGTTFADTGTIIAYALAGIMVGAVALVGLGFGWKHLKKYVTGKKF